MTRTLTVTIPLPPKGCAQNSHAHWRVRSAAEKDYRLASKLAARAVVTTLSKGGGPLFDRITIIPIYRMGSHYRGKADGLYRPLDSTNAAGALKAAVDGLVDAGIVGSDDHRHVRMMPPVLLRTKKEHQGRAEVVLEIVEWRGGVSGTEEGE